MPSLDNNINKNLKINVYKIRDILIVYKPYRKTEQLVICYHILVFQLLYIIFFFFATRHPIFVDLFLAYQLLSK